MVGVGLLSLLLTGCAPHESGRTAVSVVDGQLIIAVLGCKDGPENVGIRVDGADNRDGSAQVLGQWAHADVLPRKTIFNPASPGDEWDIIQPLTVLDPTIDRFSARGFQSEDDAGGTRSVEFSAAELKTLKPGQWLYTTQETVDDDTDEIRNVNVVAASFEELTKADGNGCTR
ncbi:hypothetical protein [Aeromicrobium sp. P5_D10]